MVAIFKAISAVFMAITTLLAFPFAGNISAAFAPQDEENVNLTFAAISDIHMKDSATRSFMLELGLSDMENADYPLDALVVAGDITDHAYEEQWQKTADTFAKYSPAKNIILAVGNHDTWGSEEDDRFPESSERFTRFGSEIMGREIDKVYYSTKVNGYTILLLSDNSSRARENAVEAKTKFEENFPDIEVQMYYESPSFYVAAGRYMTKEEAIIEMMRFRAVFPKAIAQNREMELADFIIGNDQEDE